MVIPGGGVDNMAVRFTARRCSPRDKVRDIRRPLPYHAAASCRIVLKHFIAGSAVAAAGPQLPFCYNLSQRLHSAVSD